MPQTIENPDSMYPLPTDWQADAERVKVQFNPTETLAIVERIARTRVRSPNETIRIYAHFTLSCINAIRNPVTPDDEKVAFAIIVGKLDERTRQAEQFERSVNHSNLSRRGAKKASSTRTAKANKDYVRINQAVAAHIKKRGRRKQLSITAIRHRVADELGFTYSKVLDAQRGGRKK
jgi:hypothetical protein